ncbi:MAG: hypothetical protein ACERKJ_10620 [Candidatus Dadabacteria bacterium]
MPDVNGGRVYVKDLLDPIMKLVGDMGELKGSVEGIDTRLERVEKNLEDKKDANGNKIFIKRKLSLFQRIMITIAVIGLLGGSTLLKALWDEVDELVDKSKVSQSQ